MDDPAHEKSNEIPAAQHLLRRLDLDGSLVTADAMHTQSETARIVVQEKGGDYLLNVKGNQKGVADNARHLYRTLSRGFSPQRMAQTCELNRGRTEARCVVAFDTTATRIDFPFAEQVAQSTRCVDNRRKPAKEIETECLITSRPAAQMNAEQMLRQDRQYWGIETGLHLRLDVIAGEDRSRVRHRNAVMNLA